MKQSSIFLFLTFSLINSQFTYNNQANWDPTNCGSQKSRQSPINLVATGKDSIWKNNLDIQVDSKPTQFQILNTGTALVNENTKVIKFIVTDVDSKTFNYENVNFHFHSPSEHTINGKSFDLEMHILNSLATSDIGQTPDNYAAISILFMVDNSKGTNLFLEAVKNSYIATTSNQAIPSIDINSLLFMNLNKLPYYKYKGSFTTPPCTEAVNWSVLSNPLTMTQTQLDFFKNFWSGNSTFAGGNGNNRAIQNSNNRNVILVEYSGAIMTIFGLYLVLVFAALF